MTGVIIRLPATPRDMSSSLNVRRALASVVGGVVAILAVGTATPAHAIETWLMGPYANQTTCNSTRLAYVRGGGFDKVSANCWKGTKGWYFSYTNY